MNSVGVRFGAELFLEFAFGGGEGVVFAGVEDAFGDGPGAFVLVGPKGAAGVGEEDLEMAGAAAVHQEASADFFSPPRVLPRLSEDFAAVFLFASADRRIELLGVEAAASLGFRARCSSSAWTSGMPAADVVAFSPAEPGWSTRLRRGSG